MQRKPNAPSLCELLESGFGSRRRYATSREFLQFLEGSTLDELIDLALENEDSSDLAMVVEDESHTSWTDVAPEPSDADGPVPDRSPRLTRTRG